MYFNQRIVNIRHTNANLSVSELVLCVIHIDGAQQLLSSLPVVHELALGNSTGIQNPVPVGTMFDVTLLHLIYHLLYLPSFVMHM